MNVHSGTTTIKLPAGKTEVYVGDSVTVVAKSLNASGEPIAMVIAVHD